MSLAILQTKKRILILICLIAFLILLITAICVSNIKTETTESGVAIVLNEGDLVINYLDGNEINLSKLTNTYSISITNSSTEKLYYSLELNELETEKDITIEIIDEEDNVLNVITTGMVSTPLITLDTIEASTTKRYKIKIDNIVNNTVKGKFNVINESNTDETFSNLILLNNEIKEEKTKPGTEISTTNEGLISTTDGNGISYYFRGNVDNNYVEINNNLFRIVRINGDGTVRLVLDEPFTTSKYNTNTWDTTSTYTIETLVNLNSSTLMNELQTWYQTNLSEYDKYISDGKFCTENTFENMVNNLKYSTTYDRITISKTPSLVCSNELTISKVGLLSIDEVILAGATTKPNNKYYLYNENIKDNYVTTSSYYISLDNNINMMNVNSNGSIGTSINIKNDTQIRPVININNSAKIKGTGTKNNPYIIVS